MILTNSSISPAEPITISHSNYPNSNDVLHSIVNDDINDMDDEFDEEIEKMIIETIPDGFQIYNYF